jgi:hypothetical protein
VLENSLLDEVRDTCHIGDIIVTPQADPELEHPVLFFKHYEDLMGLKVPVCYYLVTDESCRVREIPDIKHGVPRGTNVIKIPVQVCERLGL